MSKIVHPLITITLFCCNIIAGQTLNTTSDSLAIGNVNIIDVTNGKQISNQTVIITGDRIKEIGPTDSLPIPDEATVINAKGKYLIPGLWDRHAHTSYDKITRNVFFRYM